ncbi:hypothetical protein D8674_035034 [Pyrus ussuriensis x Pyrus communis]|uniref:Uncharacterized protein n=1 Tax=Pyrus ussuriensis x Pyrus communis TaxID=2448454 RepID=A0A5N5GBL1_9ROSA|nr:hypothetical protein D8674_035034 [Pyrus ussuriensis x Pyrus communis]
MTHLIRTRRVMTSTPSPTTTPSLTTTPTTTTFAPTKMDYGQVHLVDPVSPPIPQMQASLTSSVALPVSARCTHLCPRTTDQMSPSGSTTEASGTRPKHTWGPCRQLKMAKVTQVTNGRIPIGYDERHRAAPMRRFFNAFHVKFIYLYLLLSFICNTFIIFVTLQTNYNLEDMDKDMFAYLHRLFFERYKQWKSDLHQFFQQFDDSQVALEEGSWVLLCGHFQEPGYMEGSKFPKIDVFANVYVWPGNELTESLHPSVPSEYVSSIFLHHRP